MPNTDGHALLMALIMGFMNTATQAGVPAALPPCPATPNCVSSQATDPEHAIAPIAYTGSPAAAMQRMQVVLSALARSTPVKQSTTYLHYEVRSLIFRFVDDVECLLEPADSVIQIRSAARTGYSDFGVNRRRVERIRKAFEAGATGQH
jgi:uncharacterized protein (DUF1499 family)